MGEIKKASIEEYINQLEASLLVERTTDKTFLHNFTPDEIIKIDCLIAFHERIKPEIYY